MDAKSVYPQDAHRHLPFLADQGIPNLCGAFAQGVSIQVLRIQMPADGVINFAANGMSDMENDQYAVLIQNHSDPADEGTVGTRSTLAFTITGPDTNDNLDIIVVGQLKGQLKTAL